MHHRFGEMFGRLHTCGPNRASISLERSCRTVETLQSDRAKYWVGFHRVPFIGPVRIRRLVEHFGDLENAWVAQPNELRSVLDDRAIKSLEKVRRELALDREMEKIERLGINVLTIEDDGYPRLLREIPAPPPVLFV